MIFAAALTHRSILENYTSMVARFIIVAMLLAQALTTLAADSIRTGLNTNQPLWGIRGGLFWAVPPGGFRPNEPRGLIRVGYSILTGGGYDLINFIAIEPIVSGRRGFSELEKSRLDNLPGKRLWAEGRHAGGTVLTNAPSPLNKGWDRVEEVQVMLRVEQFENDAHVRLVVSQRSDRPDEIEFRVFQEPDSAPLDYCILTATMGNMARTRLLWLEDEVVSSLRLYSDYSETGFAPHREFPLSRLQRCADGGVLVAITNDEENPAAVYPFANSELWHYAGRKVTQYWMKPSGAFHDDLHAVVNGRYTYWLSQRPVPGGIAFENFELRERFYDGQRFVFGITDRTPLELGFRSKVSASTTSNGH